MPSPAGKVAAVILAAGGGGRMGKNKLLLPWKGRPLLVHVVETALCLSSLHSITVVLGHAAPRVRKELERHFLRFPPSFSIVQNRDWRQGQSASLRCGLASVLARPDAAAISGVMFLLGDQPLVRSATLNRLLAAYREWTTDAQTKCAAAPWYCRRRGNPVILARALFPRLAALRGDTGARGILRDLGDGLLLVSVNDPGVIHDVDTPSAYAALRAFQAPVRPRSVPRQQKRQFPRVGKLAPRIRPRRARR